MIQEGIVFMPTQTSSIVSAPYIDPLTCDECGHFQSKHDDQCSQWTEPAS